MSQIPALLNPATLRAKVFMAEQEMLKHEQLELPVTNHFAHKIYGREVFIPKGTLLTGKIHKYSQLNVLVSGDISVMTEQGVKRVQPPFVIVSPAGTKRIAYAHEDTIWLTVHGTEETEIAKIEQQFIATSEVEYIEFTKALEAPEDK